MAIKAISSCSTTCTLAWNNRPYRCATTIPSIYCSRWFSLTRPPHQYTYMILLLLLTLLLYVKLAGKNRNPRFLQKGLAMVLLLLSQTAWAQSTQSNPADLLPPRFIPQSPTVSAFARFDAQQLVNFPTGGSQLSVPLAEVSCGSLRLSVSLAYSYTGLQVYSAQSNGNVSTSILPPTLNTSPALIRSAMTILPSGPEEPNAHTFILFTARNPSCNQASIYLTKPA